MIVVTACFRRETKWIARRAGVRVVRTRMGERAAADLDAVCPDSSAVDAVVSTGFCGGLDGRMKTGDLFVADAVRHRGETVHLAPELVERARGALDGVGFAVWTGLAVSADGVVDVGAKWAWAAAGAIAVDMESGPLARWAASRGVPFVVVRAVLDSVDVEVPFGGESPLWLSALRHLAATADLARRSSLAGRTIGRAVAEVAASWKEASR